jgi:hypothetical protein
MVPRSRSIILVGYELARDLLTLRRLKFDLKSSIYGIIDTAWIAKEVFPSFTGALEDLLNRLNYPLISFTTPEIMLILLYEHYCL